MAFCAKHEISYKGEICPDCEQEMAVVSGQTVVRTSRGLSIAGTRITLYDIMDYFTDSVPLKEIQKLFSLTDKQMREAMEYIETHREAVEAEYQEVLKDAEEIRLYWENRNRELLARMPKDPEEIRARVQAWKARQEQKCDKS